MGERESEMGERETGNVVRQVRTNGEMVARAKRRSQSDKQVGMQQHMQWFPWKQTGKNTWTMLV